MGRARMPSGEPASVFAPDASSSQRSAVPNTDRPVGSFEPVGSLEKASLPAGAEKRRAVRQMFDTIAGHYDVLNRVNSLGMDRYWRRRCVDALDLPVGSLVLDVACGTGDLCDELARRHMQPVGLDLSSGMLAQARRRGAGGEGGRLDSSGAAPLVLGDALTAPFRPGSFDGSVSAFALRNVVDLGELFRELARLVRPAGRVSLLDLGKPEGRLLRFGHGLWTNHAVPFVGSLFSDGDAYRYLPKSLAYLPAPEQVVGLLEEAGWKAVERLLLAGGTSQIYVATRAGRP